MAQVFLSSFESLTGISPHNILRFTILIGGYILLRPLIEICFRRLFASPHEHSTKLTQLQNGQLPSTSLANKTVRHAPSHAIRDDETRGGEADGDGHASESDSEADWSWGDTARRKHQAQRQKFMEYWEGEQARLAEQDDLADITDLLED